MRVHASTFPGSALHDGVEGQVLPLEYYSGNRSPPLQLTSSAYHRSCSCPCCACVQPTANQSELTGYNVKRHEFDPEYDPDAECIIAELEFREDDTLVRALSLPTLVVFGHHCEALNEESAGLTCQRWDASTGLIVVLS